MIGGHCLTCRFWTPFPGDSTLTSGECEGPAASMHAGPGETEFAVVELDVDNPLFTIVTGCNFGCVLHEPVP